MVELQRRNSIIAERRKVGAEAQPIGFLNGTGNLARSESPNALFFRRFLGPALRQKSAKVELRARHRECG
jgi:hypothetical protein